MQQHVVTPPLETSPRPAALPPGFPQGGGVARAPTHIHQPQPTNPPRSNPPQPLGAAQAPRGQVRFL